MKKIGIGIIIAIVIIALGIGVYFMLNSNGKKNSNNANQNELSSGDEANVENENTVLVDDEKNEDEKNTDTSNTGSKTLVVYYSAQSHTKAVSEKIAENLNAYIFEIVPEEIYTEEDLNWTNRNSRVSKEHDDESLRDIKLEKDTVDNWEDYDTVLIGYPI